MNTLSNVFRAIGDLRREGVVSEYAVGGAMAVLFYAEPKRTYDLDVFVLLKGAPQGKSLISLSGVYEWARGRGFVVEAEHIMIDEVPVQFFPAWNALVEEAVLEARDLDYEGVSVRVVSPEHLIALAVQAGGAKRRERAWQLMETEGLDRDSLRSILERHGLRFEVSDNG